MATATVSLRLTPSELQYVKAALECYVDCLKDKDYDHVDLAPAGNDPHKAIMTVNNLLHDIGMK